MSDLRLVIAGCGGRMGRALIEAVTSTPGVVLAGALERAESPLVGQDAGLPLGLTTGVSDETVARCVTWCRPSKVPSGKPVKAMAPKVPSSR